MRQLNVNKVYCVCATISPPHLNSYGTFAPDVAVYLHERIIQIQLKQLLFKMYYFFPSTPPSPPPPSSPPPLPLRILPARQKYSYCNNIIIIIIANN